MSSLGDIAGGNDSMDTGQLVRHLSAYITDDSAIAAYIRHKTGRIVSTARVTELRAKLPKSNKRGPAPAIQPPIATSYETVWRRSCVNASREFDKRVAETGGWRA